MVSNTRTDLFGNSHKHVLEQTFEEQSGWDILCGNNLLTEDFEEIVKSANIQSIKVQAFVSSGLKAYHAHITTKDGKVKSLPIADPDNFVANLDESISEYIKKNVQYPLGHKFDVG